MKKKAFTLVELIISLIVILIIIASLIPIVTKKLGKNPVSIKAETKIIEPNGEIFIPFEGSAGKKDKYFECSEKIDNYITCTIRNIPVPVVNAILVGGGGGGAGAVGKNIDRSIDIKTYSAGQSGAYSMGDTAKNVKLTMIGGQGSGGAGVFLEKINEETSYIDSCPQGTESVFLSSGKEFCVTKYNVRPEKISDYHRDELNQVFKETPASLKEIKVNLDGVEMNKTRAIDTYKRATEMQTCFIYSDDDCSNNGAYPACGRTVCNYRAAAILCSKLDLGGNTCRDTEGNQTSCKGRWRLPNKTEMGESNGIITNNYYARFGNSIANSLGLCLNVGYKDCPSCFRCDMHNVVNDIFERSPSDVFYADDANNPYRAYFYRDGNNGTIRYRYYSHSNTVGYAFSVRCAIERSMPESSTYAVYAGGGGGNGSQVSNLIVPQGIIDDCNKNHKGCFFDIKIPNPASGIKGAFSKVTSYVKELSSFDGTDGGDASVEIKTKEGKILWGYKVEGGKKGKGGTINGAGKESGEATLCWEHNGTNWSEAFDCTTETKGVGSYGKSGTAGAISEFGKINNFKTAAAGRNNYYRSYLLNSCSSCGQGSTFSNSSQNPSSSYAGNSANVRITFTSKYPGASGGGGGGGAFVIAKNIKIPADRNLDVQIGGGGIGGKAQTDISSNGAATEGGEGGNAFISFGNNIFIIASGGSGGKLGIAGSAGLKRQSGEGGAGGKVEDNKNIYNQGAGIVVTNGADGSSGTIQDNNKEDETQNLAFAPASGGLGGRSGISVSQNVIQYASGCGGLFVDDISGCENNDDVNGIDLSFLSSKIPAFDIRNGYYGSYGAGGGGGGWKYDEAKGIEYIGNGAEGQGGYIYIWW